MQNCNVGTSTRDECVMDQLYDIYIIILQCSNSVSDDIEHTVMIDAGSRTFSDSCKANNLSMQWDALQRSVGNTSYRCAIGIRRLNCEEEGSSRKSPLRKQFKKKTNYQKGKIQKKHEQARDLHIYRSLVHDLSFSTK